ncbi:TPA: hypothetical protein QEL33_000279 [Stenotrophomonas maltophilia]|nr:hypothetical protein [Stenotrophomonas maltophilia]
MIRHAIVTTGAIALAVLGLGFSAPAQAAGCPARAGISYAECDDQGEAYAAAWAAATEQAGISNAGGGFTWVPMVEQEGKAYVGFVRPSYASSGRYASNTRGYKTQCSARPEETGWKGGGTGGTGSVCHNGCAYEGSVYAGSPVGLLFQPTGGTCTTNDHPAPTTPDPGEGGGDGGGTGPGDGGGDGGGTDPGGGDGGGTGPGGGDGGGGTGPGDGDGGGTDPGGGTGPGPGPGTGEGGDGGGAGPTTGRLYKKSGKTVAKVLAEFKAGIEGAPILSKVKGFFGTCTGGGSCPTATWDGGQYAGKFDLASLCSGPLLQLFQYAGFVFLAGMGVVALRWALL